jgi:hypothetical protein
LISFTKRLHEPILRGDVTCSIRIWHRCRVKVGGRYPFGHGHIKVTRIKEIAMSDITPSLARRSGFADVYDLLEIAKHGSGENVYLIDFVYEPSDDWLPLVRPSGPKPAGSRRASRRALRSRSTRPRGASDL